MARPQKNSCDYFPHDNDMRNHRKVKSIRNKFGVQGYAIWGMLLEYLTGIDGNEFEYSDLEFELISGDFGVTVTETREVVDYCIKLEMLFVNNGFVYSESLNDRLAPVYKKRGVAKELSEKQKRIGGKFSKLTDNSVVSVTETPQIKLNKIKVNESNNIECQNFENFAHAQEFSKIEEVSIETLKSEDSDNTPPQVPPAPPTPKWPPAPADEIGLGDGQLYWEVVKVLNAKHAVLEGFQAEELRKFVRYWTSKNGDKGKEAWRKQQTFEIVKRLATWKSNIKPNQKNGNASTLLGRKTPIEPSNGKPFYPGAVVKRGGGILEWPKDV